MRQLLIVKIHVQKSFLNEKHHPPAIKQEDDAFHVSVSPVPISIGVTVSIRVPVAITWTI